MKYTDEELIDELHRVSEEYCDGDTPRQKDIDKFAKSSSTPYKRFGSWNEALIEAGFEPNRTRNSISKQEVVEKIKEFCEINDTQSPRKEDFVSWADFSSGVFVRFGGWNNLLRESNLRLNNCRYATKEEMIDEIKYISEEYADGETPSTSQMDEYGQFSSYLYKKKFDGWNEALEKAGYKPKYYPNLSEEEALEDLKRLNEKLGRVPTTDDLNKYGKVTWKFYKERFGSYINALEEVGLESAYPPSGEDHVRWKGGYGNYYGPSWYRQRKKAWQRDNFKCRVCGISEEELGRKPDVHHIKPKYKFNVEKQHKEMNNLKNLICLCQSHHIPIDGKWQDEDHNAFEEKAKEHFGVIA